MSVVPRSRNANDQSVVPTLDEVLDLFEFAPSATGLSVDLMKVLIRVYVVAMFLPMRVRPVALFVGPPASGKTSLARALGVIRVGPGFEVSSLPRDERDFVVGIAGTPYVVVDNLEGAPAYFTPAVAKISTGAEFRFRRLYSNDALQVFRPDCFVAITSVSPSFLAGYLVDRSLVFPLKRREQFMPESALWNFVTSRRRAILQEIGSVEVIVKAWLAEGVPDIRTGRLADFSAVGFYVAEAAFGSGAGAIFLGAMSAMDDQRRLLLGDHDDILGALLSWVSENEGVWISAGMLLEALSERCGNAKGFDLSRRDAVRFGKYLSELRERVAGILGWRKRTCRGLSEYQFFRTQDPGGE